MRIAKEDSMGNNVEIKKYKPFGLRYQANIEGTFMGFKNFNTIKEAKEYLTLLAIALSYDKRELKIMRNDIIKNKCLTVNDITFNITKNNY